MVNALKRRRGKNAALMLLSAVALAPQIVSAQNDYVIGETPTERNTPNPIRGLEPEPIPSPAPDMSDSSVSVTVEPQKFEPVAIPSLPADTRKSDSVIEDRILKTEEIDAMLSGSGYSTPNTYAPSSTHETVGSGIVYLNEPAEVCETLPLVNHQRFWARAEAIGMWVQGDQVPSLLTTSPDATALANAGVLGQDTTILFGNDRIGQEARLGGRVSLGRWLKHIDLVGVQAEVTYLQESRDTSTFTSAGLPILARPFQNVDPGVDAADASIVAFDGLSSGSVSIDTRSEVYSGNFGFRRVSIRHTDPHRGKYANWISGFRYFRLAESLRIDDNRVALGAFTDPFGNFNAADTFSSFDSFKTQNDFYGFEFGSNFGRSRGRWTFDALAKVAIGVNHQLIEIDGSTTFGGATVAGGLLTSGDVIGQHTRRRFTVLPEVRLQTGYHLTKHIEAKIGYQFLLVSDVVRPGSEIDQQANGTFLNAAVANTGSNRPAVAFDSDTIFMHGATAALEFKF